MNATETNSLVATVPNYQFEPKASRLKLRRSLVERVDSANWASQIAVSLPGFGRVATVRRERGVVVAVLYERHRWQSREIAPVFAACYPGVELRPPVDQTWLKAQRASWLRRYGRMR